MSFGLPTTCKMIFTLKYATILIIHFAFWKTLLCHTVNRKQTTKIRNSLQKRSHTERPEYTSFGIEIQIRSLLQTTDKLETKQNMNILSKVNNKFSFWNKMVATEQKRDYFRFCRDNLKIEITRATCIKWMWLGLVLFCFLWKLISLLLGEI